MNQGNLSLDISETSFIADVENINNQQSSNVYQPHCEASSSNIHTDIVPFQPRIIEEFENREHRDTLSRQEEKVFNDAYEQEMVSNAFTAYYTSIINTSEKFNMAYNTRALFDNYTHSKALRFAAKSHVWFMRDPPTKPLPTTSSSSEAVRQFVRMDYDHAIYRVICVKESKYILLACNLNTHAFHRGDLRFIEINNRTMTNASEFSCIGHLALGDLVAVSELAKTERMPDKLDKTSVYDVNQETPCVWMVKKMTLLKRQTFENVPFSFLENRTAIALKWTQVLTVKNSEQYLNTMDAIFVGSGFIPEKVPEFASELNEEQHDQLIGLTREITKYPWSTGTIISHEYSQYLTNQLQIGYNTYNWTPFVPNPDPNGVVELCALMGATAVTAVFAGNFDCRSFRMIDPIRNYDLIQFLIDNTDDPKPEVLWKPNTRITIGSRKINLNAIIEAVIVLGDRLKIVARLSRENYDFQFGEDVCIVSQKEMTAGQPLEKGFLENIEHDTNGRKIITALYGGQPIQEKYLLERKLYYFPGVSPIVLNEYQNEYVDKFLLKNPLTLANSPFGSGKSITIATAAYYAVLESRLKNDGTKHLLVTQSNFASINLVDIIKKYTNECRVVRYVSLDTWLELPEEGRTDLDLPVQMKRFFLKYVTGEKFYSNTISLFEIASFLREINAIQVEDMERRCLNYFSNNQYIPKFDFHKLVQIFFSRFKPEIVITPFDSLRGALGVLENVVTVQFDEASQMPECALIQVLALFPNACFGLVGDIRQLPPYCDVSLTGHLKRYGIGNTMERAINSGMFPEVVLRYVYRCHPVITQILGAQFYRENLIAGVLAMERDEFIRNRHDFWPNSNFPIMIVDNKVACSRIGTSVINHSEISIVKALINSIVSSPMYSMHPSTIGVISFYKAQSDLMVEQFRHRDVKCGTVDSFQGTEKEIIILCCTNEIVNQFLAMKNRINVAMSRAKQATIIVGNMNSLRMADHWREFVAMAEKYGCVK